MTKLESIEPFALSRVCGGGETACRAVGATVGGLAAAGGNLFGGYQGLAGLYTAAGLTYGSGLVNATTATQGLSERVFDGAAGMVGMIPVVGVGAAAYTGGKLGWKAGGALCGYGWNSKS